jgi:hypothetical protein
MVSLTQENLRELHKCMRPLLHNFMAPPPTQKTTDDLEADSEAEPAPTNPFLNPHAKLNLHPIKLAYLPSILLAYNGALTFASTIVGPEVLLKSLELANLLADETNADLANVVVEAEKMEDLVGGLALSQKRLVRMMQDNATAEKRARKEEEKMAGVGRGAGRAVRKKRSALSVKKREWRGETLDLWDVTKG